MCVCEFHQEADSTNYDRVERLVIKYSDDWGIWFTVIKYWLLLQMIDDDDWEADQIFVLHTASDEFVFGQTAVACRGILFTYNYCAMVDG